MNKAEKERLERRRRMLAREQGHTSTKPIPGTSGDIGLRTPQPVHRTAAPPPEAAAPEPVQSSSSVMKVCHLLLKCSGGRAKSPVRPKTRWKDYSAKEMS